MFNDLVEKDIKLMEEEIDHRIKVVRPKFSQMIRDAKELGDLSENAEYHEAKRSKNKNEARIRYLRSMIKTAKIIDAKNDDDSVGYFDKVTVLFEDEDMEDIITISTKMRVDATQGVISKESPLGSAIFGKKVGDRVFVDVSDDVKYFVIIKKIEHGDSADVPLNKF